MFITGAGFPTQKQFAMKDKFHQLCPEEYISLPLKITKKVRGINEKT
jgi:hypothetical protein